MCGFVGFTGLREQREAILHRMADRIIHRGPDMEGYHISGDDPRTAIALGFRRLSIIDLAAGKQPMYNEDGTVVCVFNGEIYNFMDLRTELQAKGHIFKTHCDTEVIIHGYEEYGTALAAKLRGIVFGRPRKPVPPEFGPLKLRWQRGEISSRQAARTLGIAQDTFLRWSRGE